jgi:hypothetical protein
MPDISLITKSTTGEVYSIVVISQDRLRAIPVAPESREWAAWVDDSRADFGDVKNCLDFDLQNELPQNLTTKVLCDVQDRAGFAASHNALIASSSDSFLRIRQPHKNLGYRYLSRSVVEQTHKNSDSFFTSLTGFADPVAAANYKAQRFITQARYAAFSMQLKSIRAFFDPDVGPGGGWRCPEGTINGGQITDRFGRGCGGLTRRLGRLLGSVQQGVPESNSRQRRSPAPRPGQPSPSKRGTSRMSRRVPKNEIGSGATGRVFDRQQRPSQRIADAFRRTPEYRRQRDENNAAETASRRSTTLGLSRTRTESVSSERLTNERVRRDAADLTAGSSVAQSESEPQSSVPFMPSSAGAPDSGGRRQRRIRISDAVSEQSDAMADRPAKRDYFANDSRKLTDPVKTDVIEGRSLQQLEEMMRQSENDFSFGRDPSGDFEAAEQFSRAYNAIATEVRQAVRQLQAYENGEIGLSEEEANNLEKFLLNAKGVLDSELSGFNFGVDVDTRFQTPFGRNIDLGLAHPRFSNEDRAVFIEGRADFIAEAYEVSSDRNKSFAEKLRGVTEIFGRSSGQRRPSIGDGDSAQDVQRQLREAGARSVGEPQMREFFRNEFGLNPQSVENIVKGLDEIQDTLRTSDSIDEQIRENTGLRGVDERIDTLNEFLRERHFALNRFFTGLLSERESPFVGESGNELLQAIRNVGIPEIFDGVNEEDLRSPNLWRALLQRMERNESDHYFNLSDYLSSFRYNFLNRNSDLDSVDRHRALVALADGRYTEVAEQVIDKSDLKLSDARKERLTESLAQSLQKIYPKGINNESLIDRIDQTAAMAGITDTIQPNVAVNESRQAGERRRNIISLIGEKTQERLNKAVQGAKNRRRSQLGSWLERTYGRWDAKPWKDYTDRFGDHPITPDEIDNILIEYGNDPRLTKRVDDWVDGIYNIDHRLPNGAVLSSTVNAIRVDSGGLEIDGTITVTLPDGRRRDVGEFNRVLGADSSYNRVPSTVHNNVLLIDDFDLETLQPLRDGWENNLRAQGIDPSTKQTTKGSGFATVFNQHAWNWLKDAGFEDVSIRAGLKDGGYVWARMGFRHATRDKVAEFWDKVDKEIFNYEQATDAGSGLIKTDTQAAILKQLSQQAKSSQYNPSISPAHMEMIMALETDADDPEGRKKEIRDWIYANDLQLERAGISLTDLDLDPLPPRTASAGSGSGRGRRRVSDAVTEQSDPMMDPAVSKSGSTATIYSTPPKAMPDQLGLISSRVMDSGDVARPKEIVNPSLTNVDDAVSFVRNGGSLNEVPNEFWPDVLEQNSSSDQNDADALFYSRPTNQGIGGWVSVYMAKNPDGSLSTSGWVVKNSAGRTAFTGTWSETDQVGRNHSAVFDVLGFNLAATAGLAPHGAGYGGTQKRSVPNLRGNQVDVYVNSTILPLHLSVLPEGISAEDLTFPEVADFDAEIFEDAELRAIPQRVGLLVHSWALGVSDRHRGNMASFVDNEGNGYVFPFDYGMLLERDSNIEPERIEEYLDDWAVSFADINLPEEAREFFTSASFEDRQRLRDQINRTVDRMLDGYASAISEGLVSFTNTAMAGFQSTFDRMRQDDPDADVQFNTLIANESKQIFERLRNVYFSLKFAVGMRDDIKDQLAELMLGD